MPDAFYFSNSKGEHDRDAFLFLCFAYLDVVYHFTEPGDSPLRPIHSTWCLKKLTKARAEIHINNEVFFFVSSTRGWGRYVTKGAHDRVVRHFGLQAHSHHLDADNKSGVISFVEDVLKPSEFFTKLNLTNPHLR